MHSSSINPWSLVLLGVMLISGCSTDKDQLLPHGPQSMLGIWYANTRAASHRSVDRQLHEARVSLHRPMNESITDATSYSRTAQTEIYSQFKRLPNPDLVMYVFPHLAGTDPVPVPGYSTVFPFYQRVQYAMPGERTEDY
ncbi:TIGR03751 family conjugal transfer lipoprotein [Pseudomonas shahriarae]|uniref:TIGR03751 family conjugal transfer lipoprotein n=1 Tax=Pseudomonas shahriarae TaxID=2745512 RepID=UPI0016476DB6|nr:TIGR03751 family conjugal transfer lipoprotein [Pseudomonas shahriarae]QXH91983.1 TIGR03751 family conjugal transfer lipoprotein [Pseudomonas shahriarae]